jgi:hypothetical protein
MVDTGDCGAQPALMRRRAASLGRQRLTPGTPEGRARPAPAPSPFGGGLEEAASGNPQAVYGERGSMPTWLWVLIIILLVLLLFGGVGYGRRGTRV